MSRYDRQHSSIHQHRKCMSIGWLGRTEGEMNVFRVMGEWSATATLHSIIDQVECHNQKRTWWLHNGPWMQWIFQKHPVPSLCGVNSNSHDLHQSIALILENRCPAGEWHGPSSLVLESTGKSRRSVKWIRLPKGLVPMKNKSPNINVTRTSSSTSICLFSTSAKAIKHLKRINNFGKAHLNRFRQTLRAMVRPYVKYDVIKWIIDVSMKLIRGVRVD